jgi:hypothetical protein
MAVAQITIRLDPDVKEAFNRYAVRFGLKASGLAQLLLVRERKLRRLAKLKANRKLSKTQRQPRGLAVPMKTVTAHVSSVVEVKRFDSYAKSCGLTRQTAGAWLLMSELKEQWLKRALMLR